MQTPVDKSERYRQTRRVTVIGAVANAILSATQVTFGVIGQSQALVADGIHTLSDLVSDGMVLLASRIGARDADEDHPYGHARFETIATFSLASLLLVVAVELAWHALGRLTADAVLPTPGKAALIAAFAGIAVKESMYHYTRRVAKRIRSSLLHANAWHHRS
ncbi:MAG: cation transporter, partial [Chromatiales bacterium]|nr:cation transporter [Chromatiales bacterium]